MKTNSAVVTVAIILLHVICMPPQAEGFFSFWFESKSPLRQFDDYLVDHEQSSDLGANIEAAKKYLQEPKQNPEVLKLAELFVKIDAKDVCGAASVASKRNFIKALRCLEGSAATARLDSLVHDCIQQATAVCFNEFESKWLSDWPKFQADLAELKDSAFFSNIDHFNSLGASGRTNDVRGEALLLESSLNTYFMEDLEDAGTDFDVPLDEPLVGDKQSRRAVGDTNGEGKAIEEQTSSDFELTQDIIQENLISPCKRLIQLKQSKSILEPVGQLGNMVDVTELHIKPIEGDTFLTFLWASRYYHCKWILLMNKTKLAEDILEYTEQTN